MTRRSPGDGALFYSPHEQRWIARVVLEDGRRITRKRKTRAEGNRVLKAIQNGQVQPHAAKEKTGAYMMRWFNEQVNLNRYRGGTIPTYRSLIKTIIDPGIGSVALERLTPARLQSFIAAVTAEYSPRTVGLVRTVVSAALADAEQLGLINENPTRRTRAPTIIVTEKTAPTLADAGAVLAAFPSPPLRGIVTIALFLGLRQSEILGLRWQDVGADTLTVAGQLGRDGQWVERRKRGGRLVLPKLAVIDRALTTQKAHQAAQRLKTGPAWTDAGLVFTSDRGAGLVQLQIWRDFRRAVAEQGLPFKTFHDLRHATNSLLDEAGVDLASRMAILGHKSVSASLTYTHTNPERLRAGLERLERAIGG
jgi:integrase